MTQIIQEKTGSAIINILLASLCFALMALSIRMCGKEISFLQSTFIRSSVGLVITMLVIYKLKLSFLGTRKKELVWRGVVGSSAALCIFAALKTCGLGEAMTLHRASTIYIPILAIFLLKEKLEAKKLILSLIGFAATLLIIKPNNFDISSGIFLALLSGIFNALALVSVRSLSNSESPHTIMLYFFGVSSLASLILGANYFVTPNFYQASMLSLTAASGYAGQYFQTRAYELGNAATVAPFSYSQVAFSCLFGWFFLAEIPDLLSFIGMAVLICINLILSRPNKSVSDESKQEI